MNQQLKFKLLQQASKNYLCQPLPDNWYELTEAQQDELILENAWQPLEAWNAHEIYEKIESRADSLASFIDKEFQFFVLIAVAAGEIDLHTTKVFSNLSDVETALKQIQPDFDFEADDLQIIPLSLL